MGPFFWFKFMNGYVMSIVLILIALIALHLAYKGEIQKPSFLDVVFVLVCVGSVFFFMLFNNNYNQTFFEKFGVVIIAFFYAVIKKISDNLMPYSKVNIVLVKFLKFLPEFRVLFLMISYLNFYYAIKWLNN